ncbi:MAG: hypothetical protein Q8907_00520 [Bacteroidota bacterium]|nr:hypothetical protein [Bacteroidota bacterium]MDP4226693.1 hypothetical protein [Bacteroidota bacterium]MDP4272746.1 hypothetical protein [Bacteroidota bacterium]
MKHKIFTLFVFAFILSAINIKAQSLENLVGQCAANAGDDATYLKDFQVTLGSAHSGENPPVAKFSMVLSKSTVYRFSVCNSSGSAGKAIIQLFDTNRLIGSSFNLATHKDYHGFDFTCNKTGIYHVFISFQEGRPGAAVGILSFVKKL